LGSGFRGFWRFAASAGGSYGNLVDTYKFQRLVNPFTSFETQFDDFPGPLHERVEILCIGVTALQTRDRRQKVAFRISLDHDREFSFGFHRRFSFYAQVISGKQQAALR
jgi:hypothetical protein